MFERKAISVIVSVYNRLDYLHRALLSLSRQSLLPAQVVITDDGSQEPLIDFLQERIPQLPFSLKLVRQEDRGFRLARCKNNGIRAADYDFLVFWDQDLMATQGYLQTFFDHQREKRFLVAYPVRLTEEQTRRLNEEVIVENRWEEIITDGQRKKVLRQFLKEGFYYWQRRLLHLNDPRPKLRGGVFGAFKEDLLRVNGFDENYQGWGNEDDDLGRRLYASGVVGFNPFKNEFPIHLYHPPYHNNGERVNQEYYLQKKKEIARGTFRVLNGVDNPLGSDPIEIIEFGEDGKIISRHHYVK